MIQTIHEHGLPPQGDEPAFHKDSFKREPFSVAIALASSEADRSTASYALSTSDGCLLIPLLTPGAVSLVNLPAELLSDRLDAPTSRLSIV